MIAKIDEFFTKQYHIECNCGQVFQNAISFEEHNGGWDNTKYKKPCELGEPIDMNHLEKF